MTLRRTVLVAAAFLPLAGPTLAQVVPIGPFFGNTGESFDSLAAGNYTCVRTFSDQAELCHVDPHSAALLITNQWTHQCTLFPQFGLHMAGVLGQANYMVLEFDTAVTRFGGWFATNSAVPNGTIELFGPSGQMLGAFTITTPPFCTWTWNGWGVQGGPPIQRMRIRSNFNLGGLMQIDSLEADVVAPCAPVAVYCTPKSTLVCGTPAIGHSGMPSAFANSGFEVFAGPALQNRAGLLLYTDGGPSAVPFQGGTLCVAQVVRRSVTVLSGGSSACNGEFRLDMNRFAQGQAGGNPAPFLTVPGTQVHCQWWGRDSVPTGSFLSDAIEYEVCNQ